MKRPSDFQLSLFRTYLKNFVVFSDEEWEIFGSLLYLKQLKKKEYFIEAGKVCREVGFTLSGSLRYLYIKDGAEITGYFCLENDLVSSYKSFLTQQQSVVSIEALEETELIIFNYSTWQQLRTDARINLTMERLGRTIAEAIVCCYEDRVFSFITQTPEERYLRLLESGTNILNRIPQHLIANYLGITPVSLSRIRKRITEQPSVA